MTVFIALCDGFFTVHVLTTHRSASSGEVVSVYPYALSCPAMNSESLMLCEHPNVRTCTFARPGTMDAAFGRASAKSSSSSGSGS